MSAARHKKRRSTPLRRSPAKVPRSTARRAGQPAAPPPIAPAAAIQPTKRTPTKQLVNDLRLGNEALQAQVWEQLARELASLMPHAIKTARKGKTALLRICTRFFKQTPAAIRLHQLIAAGQTTFPARIQLIHNVPRPVRPSQVPPSKLPAPIDVQPAQSSAETKDSSSS